LGNDERTVDARGKDTGQFAASATMANMRKVIRMCQQDQKESDEQETLLDAYLQAVPKARQVGKAA
jgi:uncharacterized protein (UPF0335 family)